MQLIKHSNLVLISVRDGKIQIWQFPKSWRDELIEKKESEFRVQRKTIARINA